MIEHTLTEWAESLAVNYHALKAALTRAGITTEARQPVTALQIKVAILGDEKAEKVRNLKLDADLKELEKAKLSGRLYEPEIVHEIVDKTGALVRQALLQGRAELPQRCNPTSPATARTAIDQWLDRFWPEMRREISICADGAVGSVEQAKTTENKENGDKEHV